MMKQELRDAYAEPHRHYHDLRHIEACLRELAALDGLGADERRVLEYAIWWHDAIYDPTRSDNEERSAMLAERDLAQLGVDPATRNTVLRLIYLTRDHKVASDDRLGALLVSIDLSILGRPTAEYDVYAAAIRAEYAHVPDAAYRAGRTAVLKRFLAAPAIFPDPGFRRRYEEQARANMAREIASLEAQAAR
jgi:predicted metal-dependent HD superfamily phosphohydrolase